MKKILITTFILLTAIPLFSEELKNNNISTTSNSALDINGTLRLSGSTSGFVGLASAAESGSTTYTLPTTDGKAGQVLMTNGSGVLTWITIGRTNGINGQVLSTDGSGNLSWITPERTSCPSGFNLVGTVASAEAFCISSMPEVANTWLGAISNCYNKPTKAHLCSASEWAMSCIADKSVPNNMTGHWEWVADSGNNYGRIIGLAGCDSFNGTSVDAKYASRCCFR